VEGEIDSSLADIGRVEVGDEFRASVRREDQDEVRVHPPLDLIQHPIPPGLVRGRDRDVLMRRHTAVDMDESVVKFIKDHDEGFVNRRFNIRVEFSQTIPGLPRFQGITIMRLQLFRDQEPHNGLARPCRSVKIHDRSIVPLMMIQYLVQDGRLM